MDPLSFAAEGMPPVGRGVFARATVPEGPFAFAVVNGAHRDWREQGAAARARGLDVWIFSGPDYWRPENWRAEARRIEERAVALGATGIIIDPENGWAGRDQSVTNAQRRAEFRAMGEWARDVSKRRGLRVGVTSFPMMPDIGVMAEAAGGALFGAPQLYDLNEPETDETLRAWFERWRAIFGPRLAICVPAWAAGERHRTEAGMRAYLDTLARVAPVPGAIAWPEGIPIPAYILRALASYEPGGSSLGTVLRTVEAALLRPVALVIIGAVLLLAVALAFATGKGA